MAANKPVPQKFVPRKPNLKDEEEAKKQVGKYEIKRQSQVTKKPYKDFSKKRGDVSGVNKAVGSKLKNGKIDEVDPVFVRKYMEDIYRKALLFACKS